MIIKIVIIIIIIIIIVVYAKWQTLPNALQSATSCL